VQSTRDINPSNDFERLFSIILTLAGAVVFAIVLGSVSEIAQQVSSDTSNLVSR